MKTFFNLIQDVQKPGLCHRCGGCVTFCTAINYGALEIDADGKPRYGEIEKCIECGLCHAICPEIDELELDTRRRAAWSEPMGRVIETTVACASDTQVRRKATDGGAGTALLLHLLDSGRIDGAIVAKQVGPFQRAPFLAGSRSEILEAAGFFFDTSHGMKQFSDHYMTYASIEEFGPMVKKGFQRVALVGTPCQIKSVRRMQAMDLIPADTIKFCLGLFCSGNFVFGEEQRAWIAQKADFVWKDVCKINIKDQLTIHLVSGEVKTIELDDLATIRRHACRYCADYTAEFADIAFGGMGAGQGWTTVITRTPLGRAAWAEAKSTGAVREFDVREKADFASEALNKVRAWSAKKKKAARHNRREMVGKPVEVKL